MWLHWHTINQSLCFIKLANSA
uniref:Uncharacterized protein n=1 Tax=Rhizophora mucronata TaxID=61149 RepID=A0A2P2QKS8_RHIMU